MRVDCLIIDDEPDFGGSLCEYLNLCGISAAWVATPAAALEFVATTAVGVVLLDVNLEDESGFALCRTMRKSLDVPIIFLSARTAIEDVLLALEIGGDDYIPKPVKLPVLTAKIKAVLRRRGGPGVDGLRLDPSTGRVWRGNTALLLRHREYELLTYLMANPGRVVTKRELLTRLWSDSGAGDGTLNVHIRRLREKVEDHPEEPVLIKTVWGVGYVYDPGGARPS